MSIGEEQSECPLCMETLEMDDLNFFPCTCGYQICRFCWHRIRTDENGLCPACRKAYPEDPAAFRPLTDDEIQRIKKDRKMKDLQRKQKAAENRKHLANVRVVQRNLVFVVGLSQRLADAEVLRKHEYFGKFGKLAKVVINQSTSYAGSQAYQRRQGKEGPSASAYLTYQRGDDALKAIHSVNNVHVDGRTLKCSLGTTKYCSHFLRGSACNKPDCMYLHELGDEAASFTKEEMQQGMHTEYENKLCEEFLSKKKKSATNDEDASSPAPRDTAGTQSNGQAGESVGFPKVNSGDNWEGSASPTDHQNEAVLRAGQNAMSSSLSSYQAKSLQNPQDNRYFHALPNGSLPQFSSVPQNAHNSYVYNHVPPYERSEECPVYTPGMPLPIGHGRPAPRPMGYGEQIGISPADDRTPAQSLESNNSFNVWANFYRSGALHAEDNADTSSSTDDDLGFDPYSESTKALQDLIQKEKEEKERAEALHKAELAAANATPPVTNAYSTLSRVNEVERYTNSYQAELAASLQAQSQQTTYPPGYGGGFNYPSGQPPFNGMGHGFATPPMGSMNNMDPNGIPIPQNNGMAGLNSVNNSFMGSPLNMGGEAVNMPAMNNGPVNSAHFNSGNGLDSSQAGSLGSVGQYGNIGNFPAGNGMGMNGMGQGQSGSMPGMGQNVYGGGMPPHMSQNNAVSGMGNLNHNNLRPNKLYGMMQSPMMSKPNFNTPPYGRPNYPPPQLNAQQQSGGMPPNPFSLQQAQMNQARSFDPYDMKEWQESLRALLPNINISFQQQQQQQQQGNGNGYGQQQQGPSMPQMQPPPPMPAQNPMPGVNNWDLIDPAIVHSGNVSSDVPADEPHWMASLHSLTEEPVPQGAYKNPYANSSQHANFY